MATIKLNHSTIKKILCSLMLFFSIIINAGITGFVITSDKALTPPQQNIITGIVTDNNNMPLPGVTVLVVGTSKGVQTDFDGKYRIEAIEGGAVLSFSYLGFITEKRTVSKELRIDVSMTLDTQELEEVVLLGYGKTTKASFTGTIKKIDEKNVTSKNVSTISNALAGEVAGLRVFNTTGQPGRSATVRIRGFGSINGSRAPLYVLDGVPYSGDLTDINPSDIKTTVVLKDASATAIYGARGANGVILINTKKGTTKSSIEIESRIGQNANLIPRNDVIKSPEQYIGLAWESLYNKGVILAEMDPADYANKSLFSGDGITPSYNLWKENDVSKLIDPNTREFISGNERKYNPENWEDYGIRYGLRSETNLRISGGNDNTRYFTSLGYLDDEGYLINTGFKRLTARLNLTHQVKEWLKGSVNMGYTVSEDQNNGQASDSRSIFWFLDNIPSIYPLFLRDDNGDYVKDTFYGGNQYDYGNGRGFSGFTNAIGDATISSQSTDYRAFNANTNLDINFTKDFTFENKLGVQVRNSKYTSYSNPFYGSSASQNGSLFKSINDIFTYNLLNLLRYKYTNGEHHAEVLAAHEFNSYKNTYFSGSAAQLGVPFIKEIANAVANDDANSYKRESLLQSYFGQINYNYNSKYYVSATIRRDGSSKFVNNKWGTFGSAGLSWVASKEAFIEKFDWISFLKLKTSYGIIANQNLAIGGASNFYPGYDRYDIGNLDDKPSFSFNYKGNPDLTWETSNMFQTGIELEIEKHLDITLDYYHKTTDNLIYPVRVGPSSGYAIIYDNDGALVNQGFEFDVTGHLLKKKDFFVDLSLNGQMASSNITHLPKDPSTGKSKVIDVTSPFARTKDKSIYAYYLREWAGVNPDNGSPQWNVYYDDKNNNGTVEKDEMISSLYDYKANNPDSNIKKEITGVYSEATQKYVDKTAIPDITGAINLSSGYKGLTLRVQLLYGLGGYSYDFLYAGLMSNANQAGGNNYHKDILNRWQNKGDITNVPRIVSNEGNDSRASSTSTRFLIRSDYLQLNNIRLGYTLPKKISRLAKIDKIDVWASGDNLYALTARKGFTPTTSEDGSTNIYTYSPLSTFTFGIKLKF